MKKWLALVVMISLFMHQLTVLEVEAAQNNAGHWAEEHMNQLVEKKLVDSSSPSASTTMTRKDAATILARLIDSSSTELPLLNAKDINRKDPAYIDFQKLVQIGAVHNGSHLRPNEPITRAEIAKLVVFSFSIALDERPNTPFKDVEATHWAFRYIHTLKDTRIVQGNDDNHFAPNQTLTYGEFAAMISRVDQFHKLVSQQNVIYDIVEKDYVETAHPFVDIEHALIQEINLYREKNGVQPLEYDKQLSQVAIIKVQEMKRMNYFEHFSPKYGMPWELAGRFHYQFVTFGENLARSSEAPSAILKAWIQSESHRKNLLNSSFERIGIGVVQQNDGRLLYSSLFSGN